MKKRIVRIGLWLGIFLAMVVAAYAITSLFFTESYTSEFTKKQVFRFDLDTGMSGGEIGPGDSFSVSPVIIGKGYVAVSIKHAGKLIISAAVFAHTVRNLNNTLGIIDFIPKIAVYGC